MACLKMGVGGTLGAAGGLLLAWLAVNLFCAKYPAPAQQIGDIGVLVIYFLGALAVAVLLAIVGAIAGVIVV